VAGNIAFKAFLSSNIMNNIMQPNSSYQAKLQINNVKLNKIHIRTIYDDSVEC